MKKMHGDHGLLNKLHLGFPFPTLIVLTGTEISGTLFLS